MDKWYETNKNESSIISSRVRLARNFKEKVFPICAGSEEIIEIINDTARALAKYKNDLRMLRIDSMNNESKRALLDKHLISLNMANEKKPSCVIINNSENLSIMLMEEDHVRIQAIEPGDNIEDAYENACAADDIIEECGGYAFHENWGYLTSCPTNVGTGLRASFMIHAPYLEINKQIADIGRSIGKFGYTIRGTFGEGTDAFGAVYQISNQVSLGLSEEEIINNLRNLTNQILLKEHALMKKDLDTNRIFAEDRVYRAYGLLTNARQISEKEAINYLSVLKTGIMCGIMDKSFPNIYKLIINIRAASITENFGITDKNEIPVKRAEYLRTCLASS